MFDRTRRLLLIVGVFAPVVSTACLQSAGPTAGIRASHASDSPTLSDDGDETTDPEARPSEPHTDSPVASERPNDPPDDAHDPSAHRLFFKFAPDKPLFYVIENRYVDRGGVKNLLSFTAHCDDRQTIVQTLAPPHLRTAPGGPNRAERARGVTLQWVFDRYEVREYGVKDEIRFDSLRDLYPRAELRELGRIPGATVTFDFDPRTGAADHRRIQPNPSSGPPTRRRLSRTAQRCELTEQNLARLMDDLGPLFMPDRPVNVGDSWTRTRSETVKSFGQTFFDYRFTLSAVTDVAGRSIAVIDVTGETRLIPEVRDAPPVDDEVPASQPLGTNASSQPTQAATTRPAGALATQQVATAPASRPTAARGARQASKPPTDFRIDHSACRGKIEFDITRGQLISIELTRELDLSAGLESNEIKDMRLETGWSHRMRVKVLQSPPPKPIIAGGPKPPADDPPEPPGPAQINRNKGRMAPRKSAAQQPAARPTTQPRPRSGNARPTTQPSHTQATTQPGANRGAVPPASNPPPNRARPSTPRATPTTQPSDGD